MTQLVITLKDQSYLPNIRRIVKSLVGVEKVTTSKTIGRPTSRKKRLSRYEQSLLDAKEGRVNSYESSEDFFKKMGMGDIKNPCNLERSQGTPLGGR